MNANTFVQHEDQLQKVIFCLPFYWNRYLFFPTHKYSKLRHFPHFTAYVNLSDTTGAGIKINSKGIKMKFSLAIDIKILQKRFCDSWHKCQNIFVQLKPWVILLELFWFLKLHAFLFIREFLNRHLYLSETIILLSQYLKIECLEYKFFA